MLVKILSDIHLHPMKNNYDYIDHGEHVCILAGDIAEGMRGVNWAYSNIPMHIDVLYVPGNHEYYGQEYFDLQNRFKKHNDLGTHVKVLLNERVEIHDKSFAGSTLWTDFNLYGNSPRAAEEWRTGLNDHTWIKYREGNLRAVHLVNMYQDAMDFLNSIPSTDVLITHYAPHHSCSARWKNHPLNPSFQVKVPLEIHKKFKLHVHGHTHDCFDYDIPFAGTRVICNPRGYAYENSNFNGELVINI